MKKASLLVLSLVFLVPDAMAWGPRQHKAVALVAQNHISSKTLKAIEAIIGKGVSLDRIANCADAMLHDKNPIMDCGGAFPIESDNKKKTGHWHYIDIPISESPAGGDSLMKHCPNGEDCVLRQIQLKEEKLSNPRATREEKQLALMYLVHFVGDEHQPLHCADDQDDGGNRKDVFFLGKKKKLHALWDDLIMAESWQEQDKWPTDSLVVDLEKIIKKENSQAWVSGDFVIKAALESFDASKTKIYPQYGQDRGQDLGKPYQIEMQPIAMKRMAMAGMRLAAILDRSFNQPLNP